MNHWVKVDLGDAMLANEALESIKAQLANIYEKSGKPDDMLAIYRHESKGLHCSIVLYLTTQFQQLAALEHTLNCGKPSLSDSGFLAGNESRFHCNISWQ